jgi:hypothetical protein
MSCSPQLSARGAKFALVVHPFPETRLSTLPQQLLDGSTTKCRIDNGSAPRRNSRGYTLGCNQGRRKTSVWWSAAVNIIASRDARSRSATVQNDAQHGLRTTVCKVSFRTGRDLVSIEAGGKRLRHLWRCVGTASSRVGGAPSISTPPSTARQRIASQTTDLGSSHEGCEPGSYGILAFRVRELDRVLQERLSLNVRSFISRENESGRPLAFLRHKVSKELEKQLGCTTASARKHVLRCRKPRSGFLRSSDIRLKLAICAGSFLVHLTLLS